MKYRTGIWAATGFLIASCWAVYALAFPLTSAQPLAVTFAQLTQPVVLAGSYFHFGLKVWWVLLGNAATYGLVGLLAENLRRQLTASA